MTIQAFKNTEIDILKELISKKVNQYSTRRTGKPHYDDFLIALDQPRAYERSNAKFISEAHFNFLTMVLLEKIRERNQSKNVHLINTDTIWQDIDILLIYELTKAFIGELDDLQGKINEMKRLGKHHEAYHFKYLFDSLSDSKDCLVSGVFTLQEFFESCRVTMISSKDLELNSPESLYSALWRAIKKALNFLTFGHLFKEHPSITPNQALDDVRRAFALHIQMIEHTNHNEPDASSDDTYVLAHSNQAQDAPTATVATPTLETQPIKFKPIKAVRAQALSFEYQEKPLFNMESYSINTNKLFPNLSLAEEASLFAEQLPLKESHLINIIKKTGLLERLDNESLKALHQRVLELDIYNFAYLFDQVGLEKLSAVLDSATPDGEKLIDKLHLKSQNFSHFIYDLLPHNNQQEASSSKVGFFSINATPDGFAEETDENHHDIQSLGYHAID